MPKARGFCGTILSCDPNRATVRTTELTEYAERNAKSEDVYVGRSGDLWCVSRDLWVGGQIEGQFTLMERSCIIVPWAGRACRLAKLDLGPGELGAGGARRTTRRRTERCIGSWTLAETSSTRPTATAMGT